MFGPDANFEIHYQLCTGFIYIGIITYIVRACIAQYEYMSKTVEELKYAQSHNLVVYDTIIEELNYTVDLMKTQIHDLEVRLNTEIADELDFIEDKFGELRGDVVTLRDNLRLHNTKLFKIPKYIGEIYDGGQSRGIITTAIRLSDVFRVWPYRTIGPNDNVTICLDLLLGSNIKTLDFNNITSLINGNGKFIIWLNDDDDFPTSINMGYLYRLAHIEEFPGTVDVYAKTELLQYKFMKEICDDYNIEIEFPNIDKLFAKYL